jgi:signal peptidase I
MTTVGAPISAGVRGSAWKNDTGEDVIRVPGHRIGGAIRHAANLAAAALATFLVLVIGASVVCTVTNHHLEQVVTGSMVPVIPVGSMVLTEQVGVSSLHVGDILVFAKPSNTSEVIVHRIVQLAAGRDGAVQVRTKGDANSAVDPWILQQGGRGLANRAVYILPSLGTAAYLARAGLIVLLGALLIAGVVTWSRRQFMAIVRNVD